MFWPVNELAIIMFFKGIRRKFMKKTAFTLAAAVVLLTGCTNPFQKEDKTAPETTAPPATTQEQTTEPATAAKKQIFFRMGEDENTEPFLTSDHITNCSMEIVPNESGQSDYVVDIFFDDEGKDIFAKATAEAAANGGIISTWYNEYLISRATVAEAITNGSAVISGTDMREASKIAGWIYECIQKPETTANEGE